MINVLQHVLRGKVSYGKITFFLFREHWHPEFMSLDDKRHRYIPKALRPEDYMRKKGLGRRYNKWKPKMTIPLEDRPAVYKLPTTEYNPKEQ